MYLEFIGSLVSLSLMGKPVGGKMDIASIERKLEAGEGLKVKYRYPCETEGYAGSSQYGIRSDKLLDVSVELKRLYTSFRGQLPIWLEEDEVIEVVPDDGVYQDFLP